MSYVQQVCDGYSKKSLLGNWYEERLYPPQPFRQNPNPQIRKIQSDLPVTRIKRKSKWETLGNIVLDDNIKNQNKSLNKADYSLNCSLMCEKTDKQQSTQMQRPFDKNSNGIHPSSNYPNSQYKILQKNYHLLKNISQFSSSIDSKGLALKGFNTLQNLSAIQKDNQRDFDTTYKNSYVDQPRYHSQANSRNSPGLLQPQTKQPNRSKQKPNSSIPKNDIQTSLNLNKGMYMYPNLVEDGKFRHIRKDVTINNKKIRT